MTIARNIVGTIKVLGIACVLAFSLHTSAAGLGDLSATDTSSGLKEALTRGADIAVSRLGKKNGFLGDKRVKIPLPKSAQTAEKMMRTFGMKKQADELIETMNRAAEMAVVEAKPILTNAVKSMSFDDARGILTGGDDAATQYFKRTTSKDMAVKFLPIVKQATAKVDLVTSASLTATLAQGLQAQGHALVHDTTFDTLTVRGSTLTRRMQRHDHPVASLRLSFTNGMATVVQS